MASHPTEGTKVPMDKGQNPKDAYFPNEGSQEAGAGNVHPPSSLEGKPTDSGAKA